MHVSGGGGGAYALGSGAAGVSEGVADGEVGTVAVLDDLEDGAGLCDDERGHICGEAVALQQRLSDSLHQNDSDHTDGAWKMSQCAP